MILSVLLNSSKRLSLVAEILYIVGLDWVLLSSSKHDACPLGYVLVSAVLEPSNKELSSFWFQVSY